MKITRRKFFTSLTVGAVGLLSLKGVTEAKQPIVGENSYLTEEYKDLLKRRFKDYPKCTMYRRPEYTHTPSLSISLSTRKRLTKYKQAFADHQIRLKHGPIWEVGQVWMNCVVLGAVFIPKGFKTSFVNCIMQNVTIYFEDRKDINLLYCNRKQVKFVDTTRPYNRQTEGALGNE